MTKIKPVIPSLREKKRYLAFEIISGNKLSINDVKEAIINAVSRFLGEFGSSKAGIIFLDDKYNEKTQRGIIKVNRKQVDNLKSALILIKKIKNEDIIFRSIGVSGILKKATGKYLNIS